MSWQNAPSNAYQPTSPDPNRNPQHQAYPNTYINNHNQHPNNNGYNNYQQQYGPPQGHAQWNQNQQMQYQQQQQHMGNFYQQPQQFYNPNQQYCNQGPPNSSHYGGNNSGGQRGGYKGNNYNGNNRGPNPKRQKIDDKSVAVKKDGDKLVEYFCEICDREFKNDGKYQEHLATHRTCGVNGCKFVAAEKLVKIHFQNFHASGVDKRVPSTNTPEEIEKYRNERKKNFPTNLNVENKVKLDTEMVESGAVLETKQFGRFNKNKKRPCPPVVAESSEATNPSDTTTTAPTIPVTNKNKNNKNRNKNKNQNKGAQNQGGNNVRKTPTLLQQLLADEIRHERNILLQCVRYVVEKNFFQKEATVEKVQVENNVLDVEKATSTQIEEVEEINEGSNLTATTTLVED